MQIQSALNVAEKFEEFSIEFHFYFQILSKVKKTCKDGVVLLLPPPEPLEWKLFKFQN